MHYSGIICGAEREGGRFYVVSRGRDMLLPQAGELFSRSPLRYLTYLVGR